MTKPREKIVRIVAAKLEGALKDGGRITFDPFESDDLRDAVAALGTREDQDNPANGVRSVLQRMADDALGSARARAAELRVEIDKDYEDEEIDALILDLKWALGERRGLLNAIHDLEEAGLLK